MQLLSATMADECPASDVATMDRSELIALVQRLEQQRSVWEGRLRAYQERESLYLSFLEDLGRHIVVAYENMHMEVSSHAAQASELMEMIRDIQKKVEAL